MTTFNENRKPLFPFLAVIAPFFLNDFANIFIKDYRVWLTIDYLFVKLLPIYLLLNLIKRGKLSWREIGLKMPSIGQLLAYSAILSVVGITIDQFGSRILWRVIPSYQLGSIPPIQSPWLNQVDLTLGLVAVGFIEEVVFRGYALVIFKDRVRSTVWFFALSSLLFGLAHWSSGLAAFIHTALIGAVFMAGFRKTGSVVPGIIAHFVVNYVAFSGMIPADSTIFNFLK